jgi:hypothetical protein
VNKRGDTVQTSLTGDALQLYSVREYVRRRCADLAPALRAAASAEFWPDLAGHGRAKCLQVAPQR